MVTEAQTAVKKEARFDYVPIDFTGTSAALPEGHARVSLVSNMDYNSYKGGKGLDFLEFQIGNTTVDANTFTAKLRDGEIKNLDLGQEEARTMLLASDKFKQLVLPQIKSLAETKGITSGLSEENLKLLGFDPQKIADKATSYGLAVQATQSPREVVDKGNKYATTKAKTKEYLYSDATGRDENGKRPRLKYAKAELVAPAPKVPTKQAKAYQELVAAKKAEAAKAKTERNDEIRSDIADIFAEHEGGYNPRTDKDQRGYKLGGNMGLTSGGLKKKTETSFAQIEAEKKANQKGFELK